MLMYTKFLLKSMQMIFEISRFFPFFRWQLATMLIFLSVKFYLLSRSGEWRHITMPNVVEIDTSIAEILRFFNFPNGCCRHLGFSKS